MAGRSSTPGRSVTSRALAILDAFDSSAPRLSLGSRLPTWPAGGCAASWPRCVASRYARTSEEMSPGTASGAVPVPVDRRGGPAVAAAPGVVPPHRRDLLRLVPVLEVAARGSGREPARTRDFR